MKMSVFKVKDDLVDFENLLGICYQLTVDFWHEIDSRPPLVSLKHIPTNFGRLPDHGIGSAEMLSLWQQSILPFFSTRLSPRYLPYVAAGITPAALIGHLLATSTGQMPVSSPAMKLPSIITKRTMDWLLDLFDLPFMQGTFVAGTSIGHILALINVREWFGEKIGINVSEDGIQDLPKIQIFSAKPHISLIKALGVTGFGRNSLICVDHLPGREAINPDSLEKLLKKASSPFCIVVASSGTVTTGDFDDLLILRDICFRHGAWLHVDAAFGICTRLVEEKKHLIRGLEEVDSLAADAHKWLNVPLDCGFYMTRHMALLERANHCNDSYLNFTEEESSESHRGIQLSQAFRALPIFATLQAYGKSGITEWVARNCECAKKLGSWIDQSINYALLSPVYKNIVFFAPIIPSNFDQKQRTLEVLQHINSSEKVFLSQGEMEGIYGIRAAFCNWRTESKDVDIIIEVLETVSAMY
ncbi:hypothetical protein H0A36_15260 [Endozoicomonas sp. SM1973]|uniref:Pyridoxal-dependent decarboxylase n=1 Tax=Spartinivicinus marinus TaxID=2994442 RepID=A0A853IDW8_9GAMM|nr:pyridoxal-dependent decarboxylase [Spartinivicinus marinus]MCX4026212.1 pyridoxal-dependent decarboxylase [Spartinivicinus marinus]NYZ67375.1 hypothetical protein [Spartinivicinus marinus]